ncbi:conserved Plasmodium protein, unknown function [Plasmodium berghei]|uniref:Exported protein 3, putative n=2 Tax=Plasmodium berghei TaxID=5821 RepID=A0A509AGY4_PLABA|nr:exported protein 3, putative [Plasmodium berghei ANKA]CXI09084.1 conserved Plasmodium protein, unknown function [Plasmodium berghei]SCL92816.1 conserved Plasmodium protein, unknown function [Plasmodium berghei]SCM15725.1 conserved Plasmodium protein, unknown function [Plasmodium berghei]SCM17520.1 conserved Plasmodium protein, unknown function [Plasmodium berghei]SCN22927.1 conserved Plasmodium protein, unknown function [Plasmodium berghei]|eukprot:XP_034420331.1 exported protein 3, putative [Plasmodium berghei ANKA]
MILKKKLLLIVNLFIICVYLDFHHVDSKINKINYNNDDLINNYVDIPMSYSNYNDENKNELGKYSDGNISEVNSENSKNAKNCDKTQGSNGEELKNELNDNKDVVLENEKENINKNYDTFYLFKNPLNINKMFKKQMSMNRWNNIFNFFKNNKSQEFKGTKNIFLNEIQNSYAYRNGLYFSATSVGEYNKKVDKNKFANINFPDNTMILVVTGNKLFLQNLIYSANKENAIKQKFTYTMNKIINNLKKKLYFKNFNYQYLYRNDSFANDTLKKKLDMDLLGELSNITQTIYVDDNKVNMHKIYGGWFHFLGILVINGYDYQIQNNIKYNDIFGEKCNDPVPKHLLSEFINLFSKKNTGKYQNGYLLGLWKDFPNNKFVNWRYSLELFLWDLLGILPHELPHPSDLIASYNKYDDNTELELDQEIEYNNGELKQINNEHKDGDLHHFDIENTWHKMIMNKISSHKGFDATIVSAQDYMNANGYDNEILSKYYNLKNEKEYIFLILLNKDFFVDEFVKSQNYSISKQNYFDKILKEIIDDVVKILEEVKNKLFPDNDDIKPIISVYNYLEEFENNSAKINPHILGEIAGITKHLKCENLLKSSNKCTKDISIHYKYGGWFEFGGAIYVKNVNNVDISYEHRNDKEPIIKKQYEQAILSQANSNYSSAGLWRDIPEKNMIPYRYPLEVFALENPELNILNLRDIHPFIAMNILKKGLNSMQPLEQAALHDPNQIMITSFPSGNNNSITSPNIETYNDGFIINENVNVHDNTDEYNDYADPSNIQDDGIYIEIDHGLNTKSNPINKKNENTQTLDLITNRNLFNTSTSNMVTGNPFFSNNKHQSFIDNFNYITKTISNNKELPNDEDEDDDDDEYFEEEEEDADSRSIIHNNKYLKNINDYNKNDTKLNSFTNYLNKYSKNDNKKEPTISTQIYIFMIVCIIFLFIALLALIGFRIYNLLKKRKLTNSNQGIVLSLKEKGIIPVAQGLSAPWLNA